MGSPQPLQPPIYKLPPELLLHIFTFLAHPPSLITAARTCRSFHQQIFDISADKYIWKEAARAVCGFGGQIDKSGDIEGDYANYLESVRGGIPESLDELWAIGVGPVVIDVKVHEGEKPSLKGKERAVDVDDAAASAGMVTELKPMYRELCRAQMRWEKYFGARKGAKETTKEVEKLVDDTFLSFQAKLITPPSVAEGPSTATAAISSKAEGMTQQTSRRSARIAVKKKEAEQAAAKEEKPSVAPKRPIKRKSTGSNYGESLPQKAARKAKAPRYGRAHTSLPPLSTLPQNLAQTHYAKRIFSIVHSETEGTRSELGPPVVSVKMPSWGEQLDNYPLGKKSITLSLPGSGEQRQGETKREKRNRELAQGGVKDNMAFFLFSDDPRMLYGQRGAINEDSRYTVRRGVVGGSLGAPPLGECIVVNTKAGIGKRAVITQENSQQEKDGEGDITMVNGQENGIGPQPQGSASTVTNGVSAIERARIAIHELSDKIRDVSTEEFYGIYRMEQLPENNEPWLHQGKSYSIAAAEFIRPVPYTTCFPSFKKLDENRTLRKSIVEHFPSLKSILGTDEQSTTGLPSDGTAAPIPGLGLDYSRLQKLGLSNPQLNRWAKNNIHSDANLRLVPELRKKKEKDGKTISVNEETLPSMFAGRPPPDPAGLEVAEVERLTVDYDDENNELEVKTKVNLRWRMPKRQDLLSLKPPFEPPSFAVSQPPASSTAGPSTAAAFTSTGTASASAPGATTTSTPAMHIHSFAPTPPPPWAHHIAYHYQNQPHSAIMNINAISAVGAITSTDIAHLLYTAPDTETTWEFRSRGPYLVSCDDNDGVAPSTLTCFRARPGYQVGEMGDMLWQRLLAVPLHYKDSRLSVSAELRTKEQLNNLMHEFYYMDNDGVRLTSSMAVYATRRHIISPQLLVQHRKELAQDIAADIQAQTESGVERTAAQREAAIKRRSALSRRSRDKWGTGTATGYKGCCEFWFFALENGHTVKIVSLKEEVREVNGAWRGWVNWDVNDAGGLVASVGGAMDTRWKEVVRKVTKLGEAPTMEGVGKGGDKGKKKDKGKGKGKGKTSAPNVRTRSRAKKANENGDLEGFEGDGWATDYDDEMANAPQCNCPACSSDVFFDGYEGAYGYYDYDDEFTSDEEPLDPRPATRDPKYHHRYLFCWDFKAHSTDSSAPSNPGLELLPLPSPTWWNNDYDHGIYVTFSPCNRYIAASSNFRFALWDLEGQLDDLGEQDEVLKYLRYRRGGNSTDPSGTQMNLWRTRRPQMWKVPKMDLHRWTRGGLFDTWHDREHYSTQAEDQDDHACQPFNGIWVLWKDVAIPLKCPIANTAPPPPPAVLEKGVSFINSIDLRRYVDGVDMGADLEHRMEDYRSTLQEIYEERQDEIEEAEMADDDDDGWLDDDNFANQHFAMYHAQFAAMYPEMTDEDDWDDDDDDDDMSDEDDDDYEDEYAYNVFGMLQEVLGTAVSAGAGAELGGAGAVNSGEDNGNEEDP